MRYSLPLAAVATLLLAGCGLIQMDAAKPPVEDASMPFPQSIYVYDFAVSPAGVSHDSAASAQLAGAVDGPDETSKRQALERKIADTLSRELVAELRKAGLPAVRWAGTPPKNKDAYIIEGQFLTRDESSGQKIVGFALGGTELRVLAQVYRLSNGEKQVFSKVAVGKHGLAGKLPTVKLSASKAAMSVNTAVGAVQDVTPKVKNGTKETAATIVGLLKPKMQAQGWL
jgi:hypothetical protein